LLLCTFLAACGDDTTPADAGTPNDTGVDAPPDASTDAFVRRDIDASFMREDADVPHPMDDVLRLNHLQAEGTHNSYHRRPRPDTIDDWDYEPGPLDDQLESQGVRKFELDTYWDPAIARWRVYHLPAVDDVSSCELLLDCLAVIRRWSDGHSWHHPIFIQIEPKAAVDESEIPAVMDAMEEEIRIVFPDELLVTPDMVRGDDADLRTAIAARGWPTLGEVRGRVLFFLNCSRSWCVQYANDGAGLRGKLIFADSRDDDPWAAVQIHNGGGAAARAAVEAGYLVRTRALSMPEALHMSAEEITTEIADRLATGAHVVSTDVPVPREDVMGFLEMPGGTPSRCNPVTAPAECTSEAIENSPAGR
jgi:hypothetical protein